MTAVIETPVETIVTTGRIIDAEGDVVREWTTDDDTAMQAAADKFAELARLGPITTMTAPGVEEDVRHTGFDPQVQEYLVLQRLVAG